MTREGIIFENVQIRKETAKAYLIDFGWSQFWVPKSQVLDLDPDAGRLITTTWWADVSGAREASGRTEQSRPSDIQSVALPSANLLYRKLALKYHPDRNPDAEEFMSDLNQLWQAVKDDLRGGK